MLCATQLCRGLWLSSAIHPWEMETHSLKTVCGYPCGNVTKNGHTHNLLTWWNAFVGMKLHNYINTGWPPECSPGERYKLCNNEALAWTSPEHACTLTHNIHVHDQDNYKKCTLMHNIYVHDQDNYKKCTLMHNIYVHDQVWRMYTDAQHTWSRSIIKNVHWCTTKYIFLIRTSIKTYTDAQHTCSRSGQL